MFDVCFCIWTHFYALQHSREPLCTFTLPKYASIKKTIVLFVLWTFSLGAPFATVGILGVWIFGTKWGENAGLLSTSSLCLALGTRVGRAVITRSPDSVVEEQGRQWCLFSVPPGLLPTLPSFCVRFRRIPPWASDDSNSRARVSCGALDSMAWSRALGELRAPLDGRLPHSGMRAHCCLCWPSRGRATAYLFPFSCLLICPMRLFSEDTSFSSISPFFFLLR